MKKLLTILGTVGIIATGSATVVACGSKTNSGVEQETNIGKWNLPQTYRFTKGMSMGEVFNSYLTELWNPSDYNLLDGKELKDVLTYDSKLTHLNSTTADGTGVLVIIPNKNETTLTGSFSVTLFMDIKQNS